MLALELARELDKDAEVVTPKLRELVDGLCCDVGAREQRAEREARGAAVAAARLQHGPHQNAQAMRHSSVPRLDRRAKRRFLFAAVDRRAKRRFLVDRHAKRRCLGHIRVLRRGSSSNYHVVFLFLRF